MISSLDPLALSSADDSLADLQPEDSGGEEEEEATQLTPEQQVRGQSSLQTAWECDYAMALFGVYTYAHQLVISTSVNTAAIATHTHTHTHTHTRTHTHTHNTHTHTEAGVHGCPGLGSTSCIGR